MSGFARALCQNATSAERRLWQALRNRSHGAKVRRQAPCGPYVLDFVFAAARLVIEIDGETHATAEGLAHDARRTAFLVAQGYRVIRFTNSEVMANLDGVLIRISEWLDHPHPSPLPPAREGATSPSPPLGGEGRGEGSRR